MPHRTPISIRAALGLTKMLDGVVLSRLKSSLKGLREHAGIYNNPSVDLATHSAAINDYEQSVIAALDGSKTAAEEKKKRRKTVLQMYALLARYVETNCNEDMATFTLSGFQALQSTRIVAPPVSEAIRKVVQGANSGQINVKLMRNKAARSYEFRWAPVPPDGVPTAWVYQAVTLVQTATAISGLTPGTTYAFQAHALLDSGFTEWSDSVTLMCT